MTYGAETWTLTYGAETWTVTYGAETWTVTYGAATWTLTSKMEKMLMTWQRKILRKIYDQQKRMDSGELKRTTN